MARNKKTGTSTREPPGSGSTRNLTARTTSTPNLQKSTTIKNSSSPGPEFDLSDIDFLGNSKLSLGHRRKLKEVAIPAPRGRAKRAASYSSLATSSTSFDVSANELSDEYETPETSTVATPAETSLVRNRPAPLSQKTPITSHGKRKRSAKDVDRQLQQDERIAKRLQQEEYDDTRIVLSRGQQRHVMDTEDSGSFLSDAECETLFESESFLPPARYKSKDSKQSKFKARSRAPRAKTRQRPAVPSGPESDKDGEDATPGAWPLDSDFDPQMTDSTDFAAVDSDSQDGDASNNDPLGTIRRMRIRKKMGFYSSRAEYERAKLEDAHPEIKTLWEGLARIPKIIPERGEQPSGISRQLKTFQLEGLDWMRKQEQSCWKGGLLGDEMGMGKTIQAVSLIMSDYPAKDPTLVVVPPVALIQWSSEIAAYTDGKLKVLVHHNTDPKVKKLTAKDLKKYDVIMISYSGLESIHRKEIKGWKRDDGLVKENSRIHAIRYHRLILDEAHSIKSRTTGVAKACFALRAAYKWCLSGTPVQNRIGEFFSLLRFLEVRPFASYFCKVCPCSELHWSQNEEKKCTHCDHSGFSHVSIFNQELLTPLTSATEPQLRKEALAKLRLLTDRIMLRRLKRDHISSMELPPKEVLIHHEFFGEIERDFSSSIMTNTGRQFDTYVSRGVMLNNYANIFGLIMQMRQVANHPDLILKKHAEGGQNVLVCSVCDETAEEPIRSRCNHEFCRKCAKDYMRSFESNPGGGATVQPDCPRCHIELNIDFDQPDIEQDEDHVKKNSIINRIKMDEWTSSTKIEMLVYDLYKLRKKSQTHKSIVFSQFTSMLQLVEWRLRRAGFNTVMLDGSMSPAQRQRSIEYFMNNVDVEVFLVSLKAGGVALNLTEASHVFIVDPWWNPAAEWQSADRCHRIGQKRPCSITRLCIEDSVESRIVLLQEKKARLIASTVNNDDVAMEKLTPEDMEFLFRGS